MRVTQLLTTVVQPAFFDASRARDGNGFANAIILDKENFICFPVCCRSEPEWVRLTGLENIAPERTLSGLLEKLPVNSPTRITLENNGKFWPNQGPEKCFSRSSGGETDRHSAVPSHRIP